MRCRFLVVAGWLVLALGCQKPPADAPEVVDPSRPATQTAPILVEEPTPDNPFVAKAALRPAEAAGGNVVELVIEARTAPGWHIGAAGVSTGDAIPTAVEVKLPGGVEPAGAWQYPPVKPGQAGKGGTYEGRLLFRRPLTITDRAQPGPMEVQCELTYQACDPFHCLPPQTLTLSARGKVRSR
jgi:DsbC/DsbD-like thiol-disulfide interchange protein